MIGGFPIGSSPIGETAPGETGGTLPATATTAIPWRGLVVASRSAALPWLAIDSSPASAEGTAILPWRGTQPITQACPIPWSGLLADPATTTATIPWRGIGGSASTNVNTIPVVNFQGRTIDYFSVTLSADEDSWLWSVSIQLSDGLDWEIIGIDSIISVSIGSEEWIFRIDGRERSDDGSVITYSISGRSPGSVAEKGKALAEYAAGTTASAYAEAIASSAGVPLSWHTVDWVLPGTAIGSGSDTPIGLLQQLAEAVGAIVQSQPDGSLIIRPRHVISPSKYLSENPDYAIDDLEIFNTAEQYEHRPGYNRIDVLDGAGGNPAFQWESETDDTVRLLFLRSTPWMDQVTLKNSGGGHFSSAYQGVLFENVVEEIEIIDGKGRISKPADALHSANWHYVNLGTLSISETGEIGTEIEGNSLVEVRYSSRRHAWRCMADVPRVQVYIEDDT